MYWALAYLMLTIQFGLMAGDLLEGPDFHNVTGLFKVKCVKSITLLYLLTQNTLPTCHYSVAICWPETDRSPQGLLGLPLEQTPPDLSAY